MSGWLPGLRITDVWHQKQGPHKDNNIFSNFGVNLTIFKSTLEEKPHEKMKKLTYHLLSIHIFNSFFCMFSFSHVCTSNIFFYPFHILCPWWVYNWWFWKVKLQKWFMTDEIEKLVYGIAKVDQTWETDFTSVYKKARSNKQPFCLIAV